MNKDFWNNKWENNEIGFHQNDVTPLLKRYLHYFLDKNSTQKSCLLPLCGKTFDLIYLSEFFKEVTGVELIKKAVEDFYVENNLEMRVRKFTTSSKNIEIFNEDFFIFNKSESKKYSYIFDRASLIAISPDSREKYIQTIKRSMSIDCKILLITIEYQQDKIEGPPFSLSDDDVMSLFKDFKIEKLCRESVTGQNKKFKGLNIHQSAWLIKNV
tara:strand:+ start:6287 stop:6925 length:639 start_codon:yes stop_codon:yes gene_type:complete